MRARVLRCMLGLLIVHVVACAGQPKSNDALYRDLGGRAGIVAIVNQFLVELSQDPLVADHFRDSNITRFRTKLIEFICELSGGPCTYSGDTMARVHANHGIDDAEFNNVVQDLIDAMNKTGTPLAAQNRLLARLAPLHEDIVEAPGPFVDWADWR